MIKLAKIYATLLSSIEELIIWSPFGLETKKQKTSDRPFYVIDLFMWPQGNHGFW
jgi:hypothetical protein